MRLINPGLGELLDRLTILRLKIQHLEATDHFAWERSRICVLIEEQAQWMPDSVRTQMEALELRLAETNKAIWESEDRVRVLRQRFLDDPYPLTGTEAIAAAKAGFYSQQLNDRRSALVHEINVLTGSAKDQEAEKAAR